jgi:hypothetical protein
VVDFLEREGPGGHTLAEFAMLQGASYMLPLLSSLHVEIHRSKRHPGLLIRLVCQVRAAAGLLHVPDSSSWHISAQCVSAMPAIDLGCHVLCFCRRTMQLS